MMGSDQTIASPVKGFFSGMNGKAAELIEVVEATRALPHRVIAAGEQRHRVADREADQGRSERQARPAVRRD
jgi:hypothetical protein